jgi:MAP/microtubule affinity-regulating kinase
MDAIKYCHHKNVVHRDIKLENILIDDNNCIRLIDFGYLKILL